MSSKKNYEDIYAQTVWNFMLLNYVAQSRILHDLNLLREEDAGKRYVDIIAELLNRADEQGVLETLRERVLTALAKQEGKDMKEIKRYVCEICKTEYTDKAQALKCERAHMPPLEIVSQRYRPITDDQSGYPQTITVKMGDGKEVTYKR